METLNITPAADATIAAPAPVAPAPAPAVPMPLDALFATIIDALATAVAGKLPAPEPTTIDPDVLHDTVVDVVEDQLKFNRSIKRTLDEVMTEVIDDYDFDNKVDTALGNLDLTDYINIPDAVSDALDDTLDEKVGDILDEKLAEKVNASVVTAISDIDLTSHVSAALDDMDLTERINLDAAIYASAVRQIVREEIAALLAPLVTAVSGLTQPKE